MATTIYQGFSTANWKNNKSFTLTNIDLVKQDLMNHIMCPRGQRLMMPRFGTRIPMLAFEPNDNNTRQVIIDDITAVVNYDPRVQLIGINVLNLPDNNAILALVDLLYVELGTTGVLKIEIPTG